PPADRPLLPSRRSSDLGTVRAGDAGSAGAEHDAGAGIVRAEHAAGAGSTAGGPDPADALGAVLESATARARRRAQGLHVTPRWLDRKSTRLNSSHVKSS